MEIHHAYLTFADTIDASAVPSEYRLQSSDVLHIIKDRFGIDDARALITAAQQAPFEAPIRVFVLAASNIAVEAQNALLKLLEEPPQSARFYIVLPQGTQLLPTLASRLHALAISPEAASVNETPADEFAAWKALSHAQRLALVAQKTKDKDSAWIQSILMGAEAYASQHGQQNPSLLHTTVFVRSYAKTQGASQKMLLEALALSLS